MTERVPTIQAGAERLDVFEVMHRYRRDGSCDYIIEEALRLYALCQVVSPPPAFVEQLDRIEGKLDALLEVEQRELPVAGTVTSSPAAE